MIKPKQPELLVPFEGHGMGCEMESPDNYADKETMSKYVSEKDYRELEKYNEEILKALHWMWDNEKILFSNDRSSNFEEAYKILKEAANVG